MFCRVHVFGARVWESYRASRSFGHMFGIVADLTQIPGIVPRACRTHRGSAPVRKMLYQHPGYCGTGRTELTEVPVMGMNVMQNSQRFQVLWHGRT